MNHIDIGIIESAQACQKTEFCRWAENAENILRHSLDGTESVDGYSLDGAFDAFKAGITSAEYAARVQSARRGMGVSIVDLREW